MEAFGEELKKEREIRGISLDALCAETKVNVRHFASLEGGEYQALPGGVFRRGIVRAYLAALGLDEQAWMPRFQQSYSHYASVHGAEPDEDEAWATFAENVKRNRVRASESNSLRWVGVVALLVVVLVSAWATWHYVLRFRLRA